MSEEEHLNDTSEFYENLQCVKLNKKKRDKNWVPLILPIGCPGEMLAAQLTSLRKWIAWTGFVFRNEAEQKKTLPGRPSPCNVTDEELFYIDASFVSIFVRSIQQINNQ